jgi:hypothetical protein
MFENERDFRKLVGGLKIDAEPNPAHRERLRRQMLQTFEEAAKSAPPQARRLPPTRVAAPHTLIWRLAAAAVVVVSAAAVFYHLSSPTDAVAAEIAQTKLAMAKMDWMHVVTTKGEGVEHRWYDLASDKLFLTTAQGSVWCWDNGPAQKQFVYNPKIKTLTIDDLPRKGFYGSGSVFAMLDAVVARRRDEGATVERRTETFQGREVRVYRVTSPSAGAMSYQRGGVEMPVARIAEAFIVDPKTKLMLGGHIEYLGSQGEVIARESLEIDYPQSGPANIYALGVPAGARVVDRTRQPIGTPGDVPLPVPTPAPAGGVRLVPLEITLPKPMFAGMPRNRRVPNLEPARRVPRPAFLAPPGTVNVALGKPVSSSDPEPVIGSPDLITDGDKEAAEGSFLELGPSPQHVTIDLQERCEIYAILVWHYHRWPRVYFDVVVQLSDDRAFKTGVRTVFNNDLDNSLGFGAGTDPHYTETYEGKLIDLLSQGSPKARYLRLYSNGNTHDELNHYLEVEVYGRPLD